MAFFFFLLVLITVLVLPVVVIAVVKAVPRLIERSQDRAPPELESRLVRIEEAIDAMAVEIERLRTAEVDAMSAARRIGVGEEPPAGRDL